MGRGATSGRSGSAKAIGRQAVSRVVRAIVRGSDGSYADKYSGQKLSGGAAAAALLRAYDKEDSAGGYHELRANDKNLVSLASLSRRTGFSGPTLKAAFNSLRRDRILSGSPEEGRHGAMTAAERAHGIEEGDRLIVFAHRLDYD